MSSSSSIEWTDATWNPVTGCSRVSPGCAHCYALEFAPRLRRMAEVRGEGKWLNVRDGGKGSGPAFGVTLHPAELEAPLAWRRPRMVFVNSMSDLFHEEVPFEFIDRVFEVMVAAEQHTFQVLTKRPERMLAYFEHAADTMALALEDLRPWPNVWLGTTIENRRFVGRADVLRETPAAVRFISAEPLLGPLLARFEPDGELGEWVWPDGRTSDGADSLDLSGIDWLIAGGESGHGHRPIRPAWVRDLRDEAQRMRTSFFFKQWGGRTPKAGGRELDGRTWDEMPATGRTPAPRGAVPAGQAVAR